MQVEVDSLKEVTSKLRKDFEAGFEPSLFGDETLKFREEMVLDLGFVLSTDIQIAIFLLSLV